MTREFLSRFLALFGRKRRDRALDEEIRAHLDLLADEYLQRGMSPGEARAAARRDFGGVEQMKEQYRDRHGWPFLESLAQDARYTARTLRRDAVFSVVAVLTLALGIGTTTTIFGGVKAVLLDPLPYPDAGRIAQIIETSPDGSRNAGTFGMYRGLVDRARSFEAMAVMKPWQPTMTTDDQPERFEGQRVSARYFDVLRVSLASGRTFQAADDQRGATNVVILSDALWRRRFGGDPAIVGRSITLDDTRYTVVGVAPRDFENVLAPSAEIWAPLQYDMSLGSAWGHHLSTVGRLRNGITPGAASREIDEVGHAVLNEWRPATYGQRVQFVVTPLGTEITRAVRPSLLAVLGAVVLLLVVASVNVTNLLLTRGAKRRSELMMRMALGAGRARLVRLVLVESVLLAAAGGALAVGASALGVRALVAFAPAQLPRANAIRVDGVVFVFATVVTTLVGLLAGLIPALQASRQASPGAMRAAGRSITDRQAARRTLVAAEVALAVVLLVSAGLLFRSFQRLFAVAPGFDPSGRITMQVQTSGQRFDKAATERFFTRALEAVRDVPGVETAAFTSQLPLSGDDDEYGARFEDDPDRGYNIFRYAVSSGYFEAMSIAVRRGRAIDARDAASSPPIVVISESLARRQVPRAGSHRSASASRAANRAVVHDRGRRGGRATGVARGEPARRRLPRHESVLVRGPFPFPRREGPRRRGPPDARAAQRDLVGGQGSADRAGRDARRSGRGVSRDATVRTDTVRSVCDRGAVIGNDWSLRSPVGQRHRTPSRNRHPRRPWRHAPRHTGSRRSPGARAHRVWSWSRSAHCGRDESCTCEPVVRRHAPRSRHLRRRNRAACGRGGTRLCGARLAGDAHRARCGAESRVVHRCFRRGLAPKNWRPYSDARGAARRRRSGSPVPAARCRST